MDAWKNHQIKFGLCVIIVLDMLIQKHPLEIGAPASINLGKKSKIANPPNITISCHKVHVNTILKFLKLCVFHN